MSRDRLKVVNGGVVLPRADRVTRLEQAFAELSDAVRLQGAKQSALIAACMDHGLPLELFKEKLKANGISLVVKGEQDEAPE